MCKKIKHYSLTNPASVYDEEALTALELAGRTAKMVNGCIENFNELETNVTKNISDFSEALGNAFEAIDGAVEDGVKNAIENGDFDDVVRESNGAMVHEIKVISARVDNIVSMEEGSTTGDAELIDIRVGGDGVTYPSAGSAVRSQFDKLNDTLDVNVDYMYNPVNTFHPELVDGFVRVTNGEISDENMEGWYKRTTFIPLPNSCVEIIHDFTFSSAGNDGYAFFNHSKEFISGGRELEVITDIPEKAKYFMITNYEHDLTEAKTLSIRCKNIKGGDLIIKTLVTYGDSHVGRGGWQNDLVSFFGVHKHVNLGVGSSTIAINDKATVKPFVDDTRLLAIETADPDYIVIIGGTNDVHLDSPLGDASEFTKDTGSKNTHTVYGAYCYLIEKLLTWKPSLQIVLCTPPQGVYDVGHAVSYYDVAQAVKEIGNYYSIKVCDLFGRMGINKKNLSTFSDDLIHMNNDGNARLAALVIDTLVTGSAGRDGKDGVNGQDGRDGVDGVNGQDGRDGVDGEDGQDAPQPVVISISGENVTESTVVTYPEGMTVTQFREACENGSLSLHQLIAYGRRIYKPTRVTFASSGALNSVSAVFVCIAGDISVINISISPYSATDDSIYSTIISQQNYPLTTA